MIKVKDYLKITNYKKYRIKDYYDCFDGMYFDVGIISIEVALTEYKDYIINEIGHETTIETEKVNGEFKPVINIIPILYIKTPE